MVHSLSMDDLVKSTVVKPISKGTGLATPSQTPSLDIEKITNPTWSVEPTCDKKHAAAREPPSPPPHLLPAWQVNRHFAASALAGLEARSTDRGGHA